VALALGALLVEGREQIGAAVGQQTMLLAEADDLGAQLLELDQWQGNGGGEWQSEQSFGMRAASLLSLRPLLCFVPPNSKCFSQHASVRS